MFLFIYSLNIFKIYFLAHKPHALVQFLFAVSFCVSQKTISCNFAIYVFVCVILPKMYQKPTQRNG